MFFNSCWYCFHTHTHTHKYTNLCKFNSFKVFAYRQIRKLMEYLIVYVLLTYLYMQKKQKKKKPIKRLWSSSNQTLKSSSIHSVGCPSLTFDGPEVGMRRMRMRMRRQEGISEHLYTLLPSKTHSLCAAVPSNLFRRYTTYTVYPHSTSPPFRGKNGLHSTTVPVRGEFLLAKRQIPV